MTDRYLAVFDQARHAVDNGGYAVVSVPANYETGMPGYCYTVSGDGLAEYVVMGLGVERAAAILDAAHKAARRVDDRCGVDRCADDIQTDDKGTLRVGPNPIRMHPISPQSFARLMPIAHRMSGDGLRQPAWQVLWADAAGRYPDDSRFDPTLRNYQPLVS